jgi:hypothetical protein
MIISEALKLCSCPLIPVRWLVTVTVCTLWLRHHYRLFYYLAFQVLAATGPVVSESARAWVAKMRKSNHDAQLTGSSLQLFYS